jgi:hypothetical protein
MKVRASDFCNKSFFLSLVEEAQERDQLPKGPLSWDECDSIVDLDEIEIDIMPLKVDTI